MKIRKFKFKQILQLHLLNSKIYEAFTKRSRFGLVSDFNLTEIISDFKRALHVIYQFHKANKKILFVGIPKGLELKINKLTPHAAIPSALNFQGILLQNLKSLKITKKLKLSSSSRYLRELQPKLSKKPDLIVLLTNDENHIIAAESYATKVPLIIFGSDNLQKKSLYKVNVSGSDMISVPGKNLFVMGLNFIFTSSKGVNN